jgi:hypothetical protein
MYLSWNENSWHSTDGDVRNREEIADWTLQGVLDGLQKGRAKCPVAALLPEGGTVVYDASSGPPGWVNQHRPQRSQSRRSCSTLARETPPTWLWWHRHHPGWLITIARRATPRSDPGIVCGLRPLSGLRWIGVANHRSRPPMCRRYWRAMSKPTPILRSCNQHKAK